MRALFSSTKSITEDKHVRDLLYGIKNPTINAAKPTILVNPHLGNDFMAAATHLAASLQLHTATQYNISKIGKGGGGRGRGGSGRQHPSMINGIALLQRKNINCLIHGSKTQHQLFSALTMFLP
jgi:hypothetical protein